MSCCIIVACLLLSISHFSVSLMGAGPVTCSLSCPSAWYSAWHIGLVFVKWRISQPFLKYYILNIISVFICIIVLLIGSSESEVSKASSFWHFWKGNSIQFFFFLILKVHWLYRDTKDFILATETKSRNLKFVIEDHGLKASALPPSLFFTGRIERVPFSLPSTLSTFVWALILWEQLLSLLHSCSSYISVIFFNDPAFLDTVIDRGGQQT